MAISAIVPYEGKTDIELLGSPSATTARNKVHTDHVKVTNALISDVRTLQTDLTAVSAVSNLSYTVSDSADATSLAAEVATEAAKTDGGTLVIASEKTISANLTIPDNVRLIIRGQGKITHGALTVTVNGAFFAGLYQVFDGTGQVTFGVNSVERIIPQWFGADPDGSTNSTTAIQKAINTAAVSHAVEVIFSGGIYMFTQLEWKKGVSLIGTGNPAITFSNRGTTLRQIAGTNMDGIITDTSLVAQSQHWVRLENMRIECDTSDTSTTGSGLKFNSKPAENTVVRNIIFNNWAEHGVHVAQSVIPCHFERLHFFNNGQRSGTGAGIKVERQSAQTNAMVYLSHMSGDDNETALIWLDGAGGGRGTYVLTGIKCETNTAGKQQNHIYLEDMSGHHVLILGVYAHGGVSYNSVIKVVTSNCRVDYFAIQAQSPNATYVLDDDVNSLTVSAAASGHSDFFTGSNYERHFIAGIGVDNIGGALAGSTVTVDDPLTCEGQVTVNDVVKAERLRFTGVSGAAVTFPHLRQSGADATGNIVMNATGGSGTIIFNSDEDSGEGGIDVFTGGSGTPTKVAGVTGEGEVEMIASLTGDTAPTDDTSLKKFSIQRLGSDPTNAAFLKFSNSPGTPTNDFYLVLEEG